MSLQIPCSLYTPSWQFSAALSLPSTLLSSGCTKPRRSTSLATRSVISEHEGLRSCVSKHRFLPAFFLLSPLWPRDLWQHHGWVHSWETNARQGSGGKLAGYLLGCQPAWCGDWLHAGSSRTSGSFRGADMQPNPPPQLWPQVSQPGSPESRGSSRGFPASLQTGGDVGDVVATSFSGVWAAGSVTSRPKALVILASSQSPMVAETWKQRADESWDSQAPLCFDFDGYLFQVSPLLASLFSERLKNIFSCLFPKSKNILHHHPQRWHASIM